MNELADAADTDDTFEVKTVDSLFAETVSQCVGHGKSYSDIKQLQTVINEAVNGLKKRAVRLKAMEVTVNPTAKQQARAIQTGRPAEDGKKNKTVREESWLPYDGAKLNAYLDAFCTQENLPDLSLDDAIILMSAIAPNYPSYEVARIWRDEHGDFTKVSDIHWVDLDQGLEKAAEGEGVHLKWDEEELDGMTEAAASPLPDLVEQLKEAIEKPLPEEREPEPEEPSVMVKVEPTGVKEGAAKSAAADGSIPKPLGYIPFVIAVGKQRAALRQFFEPLSLKQLAEQSDAAVGELGFIMGVDADHISRSVSETGYKSGKAMDRLKETVEKLEENLAGLLNDEDIPRFGNACADMCRLADREKAAMAAANDRAADLVKKKIR